MSRILMVTPSLDEPGGIASVVSAYMRSPLASHYDLTVIETVRGRGVMRHIRGVVGAMRACVVAMSPSVCAVHAHVSVGASFWRKGLVLTVARMAGKPTILHLHGGRFPAWARGGSALRARAVRRAFARATVVAVLSESWARDVAEFSGRAGDVVVPNPVEVSKDPSSGVGGSHIVYLGRLDARKGTGELFEAMRRLQEQGFDARWTIAGDGDVAGMRARVAGLPDPAAVTVPGWLDRTAVAAVLSEASVFCLPSTDEGLPVAMLEAMAYGVPPVVTPVGGIPEVVEDGVNGVIVEVGNADSLTEAIRALLQDPHGAARMGAQARSTVEERFASDKVATTVGAMYESVGCARREGRE